MEVNISMVLLTFRTIFVFHRTVCTSKYIINTTGSKIQDFNMTFDDKPKKIDSCGDRHVVVEKISDNKIRFVLNKDMKYCCYSYKSRSNLRYLEEIIFTFTPCKVFKNLTEADLEGDMIAVKCEKFGAYKDYYVIVRKNLKAKKAESKDSYNVLLLGIDTMSRKRLFHSMKETTEFIKKNDWLDFRGYTKIDTDTIPNFTALLTGIFKNRDGSTGFMYSCVLNTSACNDLYLWSEFKKNGYVTAFVEDNRFHVESTIREVLELSPLQPTDHYIGPIFKDSFINNITYCAGKLSFGEHVLNNGLDFANTYKENKFFGAFWISTQSPRHSPVTFDVILAKFFRDIKATGILDNTFVIFLSDHGVRFGIPRFKMESYFEELPMLFMNVPTKFKKNHAQKYKNLQLNERRLTSPFDLHLTMKNILNLKEKQMSTYGCKTCLSLFENIPQNRRCADAGIEYLWCARNYPLCICPSEIK